MSYYGNLKKKHVIPSNSLHEWHVNSCRLITKLLENWLALLSFWPSLCFGIHQILAHETCDSRISSLQSYWRCIYLSASCYLTDISWTFSVSVYSTSIHRIIDFLWVYWWPVDGFGMFPLCDPNAQKVLKHTCYHWVEELLWIFFIGESIKRLLSSVTNLKLKHAIPPWTMYIQPSYHLKKKNPFLNSDSSIKP